MKVDVVKVNADIYRRIGIPQPSVRELLKVTQGDQATWSMYAKGLTMGLNQAEREKSAQKVMRYKPQNISELSAFVAGIRPAFQSMVELLLNRQHFEYNIPVLDKLLQTEEMPNSFILYQEQMMSVLQYAGFTAPESYTSIKAIAKKHPEKVLPLKERFLSGFADKLVASGTGEEVAKATSDKVWTIISDACSYGFNSCVIGSTRMFGQTLTIEDMYLIRSSREYASCVGYEYLHDEYNRNGFGKAFSLCPETMCVHPNDIVGIYPQGIRPVYRLTTSDGSKVICTDNHKFPVYPTGELVELRHLRKGDCLYVRLGVSSSPNSCRITEVKSIKYRGESRVYDVEMAGPHHTFTLENGLVVGNSHSVAVALDSLYTAYAKAHWPLQTYVALLTNYAAKGDKARIDKAKEEMKRGFGIRIVPCKFRQDNRDYYVDYENNTISDALMSVKHLTRVVANALYEMRSKPYETFVDVLYEMTFHPAFDSRVIEILIRMGYFKEFGSPGKLLDVLLEFRCGVDRFSKNHVPATQQKRLAALRAFEAAQPEKEIPIVEQMRFEVEHYGTPISEYPEAKKLFTVIDVDTKYSPKVKLYNVARGTVGTMKLFKNQFSEMPFVPGDTIELVRWEKKPAYRYSEGKRFVKVGVFDNWIEEYRIAKENEP